MEELINQIKTIYKLPVIEYSERVNAKFLKYIGKKHYFVVMALFDSKDRLFLSRDFGKNYGWELLGGSIDGESIYDFNDGVQNIADKIIGTQVFDIQPIAFVINRFFYKKSAITHIGLAYIARPMHGLSVNGNFEWGFMKNLPIKMFTTNLKIAQLALKIVNQRKHFVPYNEIIVSDTLKWRRFLHKNLINPLFDKFSTKKIRKSIFKNLNDEFYSFLDVSSGDDDLIIEIDKKFSPKMLVCNDISINHIDFLKRRIKDTDIKSKIIFTHHNILELPFKYRFDVILCKNTLHHFKNNQEILNVLEILKNLGKKILIVDIENPKQSTFLSWLWNKYYVYFLKDQGGNFMNKQKLANLLNIIFSEEEFLIKDIPTIKGNYLLVVIKPKSKKSCNY